MRYVRKKFLGENPPPPSPTSLGKNFRCPFYSESAPQSLPPQLLEASYAPDCGLQSARKYRNTCLAQYIYAETAIFNFPLPRFNVESLSIRQIKLCEMHVKIDIVGGGGARETKAPACVYMTSLSQVFLAMSVFLCNHFIDFA